MNFKKFISSVSALAIAGSAFAGMAVTANAADTALTKDFSSTVDWVDRGRIGAAYDEITGLYHLRKNGGNQARGNANFSSLVPEDATQVKVEFDAIIPDADGRIKLAVGDAAVRKDTNAASNKVTYDATGSLLYLSNDGGSTNHVQRLYASSIGTDEETGATITKYGYVTSDWIGGNKTSALSIGDKKVRLSVTLDRVNHTYSYKLTDVESNSTILDIQNVATLIDNLSVVDAYTWNESDDYVSKVSVTVTRPAYAVTTTSSETATVSTDMETAVPGEIVTVTAAAAEGYENPVIQVNGEAISGNTFTMPANNVEVTATATAIEIPAPSTHTEAFTFEKTASELGPDANVMVIFKNNSTGKTEGLSEALGTTFAGASTAKIAVVVTNIADGYSVQSITIE